MSYNEEYLKDENMNINWYPGHMKKTRELMQNNLRLVDVVVELLDARIPFSSKNPDIDNIIGEKPKVVVLNKYDMCEKNDVKKWIKYYEEKNTKAIPVNSVTGDGVGKIVTECKNITQKMMDKFLEKGRKERAIRMMIVGVPNVGKSSLINKLSGRKSAQTGDRPGVTKGKQWVKIKGNMELLDTPGILWPKFDDQKVALNLAFTKAIKDEILDVETLCLRFIERMIKINPQSLLNRYNLEDLGENPLNVMEAIGRKRGFLLGRNELDYTRIATTVLNEFREGKLGKITLEFPDNLM